MRDLAKIHNYAQKLIDESGKNIAESLDFLDGFVYALLLVQKKIKEVNYGETEKKD